MNEQYGALARAYDDLMYDVPYAEWAAYLLRLLRERGVARDATVLEYACGTGNMTLELLKAGYDVAAVDVSEDMLNIAQEKARAHAFRPRFACADMAEFRLNKPVDAAVCVCDGVNYLPDQSALDAFLKNARENLLPGGALLFDVSTEYKFSAVLGDEFFYDDGEEQTLFWQNRYDPGARRIEMELTLFLREGAGYTRLDEKHVQRAWSVEELGVALEKAGFSEIAAYAFPTHDAPGNAAERVQFAACRGDI